MAGGSEKSIIHCCVDRSVYEMLERHCEATGQTKTTAVKRAIQLYCQANGVHAAGADKNTGGNGGDGL